MQRQLTDFEIETLITESKRVYLEEKIPEPFHNIIHEINIATLNEILKWTEQLKNAPSLTLVMDIIEKNTQRNKDINEELKTVFSEEEIARINKSGDTFKETDLLKQIFRDFEKALKEAPELMMKCDWDKAFELATLRDNKTNNNVKPLSELEAEYVFLTEQKIDFKETTDKLDELNRGVLMLHLNSSSNRSSLFSRRIEKPESPASPESPGYSRYMGYMGFGFY